MGKARGCPKGRARGRHEDDARWRERASQGEVPGKKRGPSEERYQARRGGQARTGPGKEGQQGGAGLRSQRQHGPRIQRSHSCSSHRNTSDLLHGFMRYHGAIWKGTRAVIKEAPGRIPGKYEPGAVSSLLAETFSSGMCPILFRRYKGQANQPPSKWLREQPPGLTTRAVGVLLVWCQLRKKAAGCAELKASMRLGCPCGRSVTGCSRGG